MGHHARGTITARHYSRHSFECEKREALDAWASRLEEILGTSGSYRSRLAPESPYGPNPAFVLLDDPFVQTKQERSIGRRDRPSR